MEVAEAHNLIANAIANGHPANGYLICGDVDGDAVKLVEAVLKTLFPDDADQIENRCHPDVVYLLPEGKSRTIHVESMRDQMVAQMEVTSFSGGWKAGVVIGADRMEMAAANSFLKLLEEPPAKTMFLLVTDRPDSVLPTIISRTQRIDLKIAENLLEGNWLSQVEEVMTTENVTKTADKALLGRRLAKILAKLKDEAEDEDVQRKRKAFFSTIMRFVRQWMTENRLPRYQAFRNIEAVENAYRQCERYMSDDAVLSFMTDRIAWP